MNLVIAATVIIGFLNVMVADFLSTATVSLKSWESNKSLHFPDLLPHYLWISVALVSHCIVL